MLDAECPVLMINTGYPILMLDTGYPVLMLDAECPVLMLNIGYPFLMLDTGYPVLMLYTGCPFLFFIPDVWSPCLIPDILTVCHNAYYTDIMSYIYCLYFISPKKNVYGKRYLQLVYLKFL